MKLLINRGEPSERGVSRAGELYTGEARFPEFVTRTAGGHFRDRMMKTV